MKYGQYHYYVEGENERVLVEILSKCKDEKFNVIRPGKIDIFNVVEREIKSTHMLNLKDNLNEHLIKAGFTFNKLWRKNTNGVFAGITSGISKIEK